MKWINLFNSQPIKWNSIVESSHAWEMGKKESDREHLIKIEYWLNYLSFQLRPLKRKAYMQWERNIVDSLVHWRSQLLMLMNHAKFNESNTSVWLKGVKIKIFYFLFALQYILPVINGRSLILCCGIFQFPPEKDVPARTHDMMVFPVFFFN